MTTLTGSLFYVRLLLMATSQLARDVVKGAYELFLKHWNILYSMKSLLFCSLAGQAFSGFCLPQHIHHVNSE